MKSNLKQYLILIFSVLVILFVFFLVFKQKHYSFDEAVEKINRIDERHNVSFSDYQKGLFYLRYHPRYPNPFNVDEIKEVIKEYSKINGDEPTNLFVDFRKNLLEAEMNYRLSYKNYKGDIQNYPLQCRNKNYVYESVAYQNESIREINEMLTNLSLLKERYPIEFSKLNISEDWIKLMNNTIVDFQADIDFKLETFNQFCNKSNETALVKDNLRINES